MSCKEISKRISQDLFDLWSMARSAEGPKEADIVYQSLLEDLVEYDKAWRAEVKRVADNVQEEMREE